MRQNIGGSRYATAYCFRKENAAKDGVCYEREDEKYHL